MKRFLNGFYFPTSFCTSTKYCFVRNFILTSKNGKCFCLTLKLNYASCANLLWRSIDHLSSTSTSISHKYCSFRIWFKLIYEHKSPNYFQWTVLCRLKSRRKRAWRLQCTENDSKFMISRTKPHTCRAERKKLLAWTSIIVLFVLW